MQTILFIKQKLSDKDVSIIEDALDQTRVDYKIKQADNLIIVKGRNDIVHAAKVALREAGYSVE
jgi:hypothetical protein